MNPMMGDVEQWEFQFAEAVVGMLRPSMGQPSTFSQQSVMEMLSKKITLANATLIDMVTKGFCSDPIAGAKEAKVLLTLSDYCVLINLAVLGLKRAVQAVEIDELIGSIPFPKSFDLGGAGVVQSS